MRALLVLLALAPATALANGAFPDTEKVLLPADRPQTIVLGTNFGLVITEDGGAHWRWTCEHGDALGGYRYTLAGDQRRLVALAGRALIASDDLGCQWRTVGREELSLPFDFFPDGDPAFALALVANLQTRINSVVRFDLRAATGAPVTLYQAPPDHDLTTVEAARSDPRVLYATLEDLRGPRTRLLRSGNAGQSWTVEELAGPPELRYLGIAAVDPGDPARLYFRAATGVGEALVISDDGGKTVRVALTTSGAVAGFLPLHDGALVSTLELDVGRLYRQESGAFVEVTGAGIAARGFAERAGLIYAATDNVNDTFALAVSRDRGRTWERVMAFQDIEGTSRCSDLAAVCQATCSQLVTRGALPPRVCAPPDAGPPPDAQPVAAPSSGCSCHLGGPREETGFVLALVLVLALGRKLRPGT